MLADTPANRRTARAVITLFKIYGPLCLVYTLWALLAKRWPSLTLEYDGLLSSPFLLSVCVPEAAFYAFSLWHGRRLQAAAIHPPLRTKVERLRLFEKVRGEVRDFKGFLRGWFSGAELEEIGLDELRRWIDWAFWEGRAEKAKEKEGDTAEIEEYVKTIEQLVEKPFREGPGKAKALRLTLDPVAIEPRSLAWYALIVLVDTFALLLMKSKGFRYHRRTLMGLAEVFPPRPAALYTRKISAAPSLSYFQREHTSKTRLPVIYLHGIGIGLLPHVEFLDELYSALNAGARADDQVGILAVETLQISSRLTSAVPRSAEFVSQLTSLINQHFGSSRVVLVAHSYGTILSTPALNDPHLSSRISGTLFIDPVSIQLYMPDVAHNFTRRKPIRAEEWALSWLGKDPGVAHTLGRHLFWSESVLWRDQIEYLVRDHGMKFTASLSSEDLIVNTRSVRDYLVETEESNAVILGTNAAEKRMVIEIDVKDDIKAGQWRGKGLEILWWNGYSHAGALDARRDRATLIKVVVQYCGASGAHSIKI